MPRRPGARSAQRPPAVLYHYTAAEGMLSMLRTGHIWATDAAYLNDPNELRYGFDLLAEVLGATLQPGGLREVVLSMIEEAVQDKVANGRVYVASFCGGGDLLSQWRGYGSLARVVPRQGEPGGAYGDLDLTRSRGPRRGKLPIVEIVCGPTINRERGLKALRQLCESLGYWCRSADEDRRAPRGQAEVVLRWSRAPFVG